jgi:hypothetical protein
MTEMTLKVPLRRLPVHHKHDINHAMIPSADKQTMKPPRYKNMLLFQRMMWIFMIALICIITHVNNIAFLYSIRTIERDLLVFSRMESMGDSKKKKKWSDVRLAIYMTTHLSKTHLSFLPCWYDAIHRLEIFQHADLILYTPSTFDPVPETILQQLSFPKIIIKYYNNTGYQDGAIQAMIDPFLPENNKNDSNSWFDDYDWVIRLNPDVLIRNDTWLIQSMMMDSIDGIFHDCFNRIHYPADIQRGQPPLKPALKFHSDFYAFRPVAVRRDLVLSPRKTASTFNPVTNRSVIAVKPNAERHLTESLWNIFESSRFLYLEGGHNFVPGRCRLEGIHSPVIHAHELAHHCPYYYNVTSKEGIY